MTRRRAIFIGLFAIPVVLGLGLYFFAGSKTAFNLALNAAKSAGFDIQAKRIAGNLFSGVTLEDLRLKSAFVNGAAKIAKVKYPLWQLITKRDLRLDVTLEDGSVEFDPSKLPPADANAPAPPVNVSLERASVHDVRLKLNGKFIEIPNVTATILEQHDTSGKDLSGTAKLLLETLTGAGTADVQYQISKDWALNLVIDADLDAKISRYWYKDIKAGRILAHYNLQGETLTGSGEIKDGVLEPVPGIVVKNVNGPVTHSKEGVISGHLKALALEGAVDLTIKVNTAFKQENISVTGWAEPKILPALKAFKANLPASGEARVSISGGGWEKLAFTGKISGNGQILEFPLEKIAGDWKFQSPGDLLSADITSNSRFLDAPVNANANLEFNLLENQAVINARIVGEKVLGAPLEAKTQLNLTPENLGYSLESRILNGQVKAKGDLKSGKTITGSGMFTNLKVPVALENRFSGNFKLGGLVSNILITGTTNENLFRIPAVKPASFPGNFALQIKDGRVSGRAKLGEFSWNGNLKTGVLAIQKLKLEPAGVVTANANYTMQGAKINLAGNLSAAKLEYQGAKLEDAAGSFTLEVDKHLNGYWNAGKLEAFLYDDTLRFKPRNWLLTYAGQEAKLSGNATYNFNGNLNGEILASTKYGVVQATGQGKTIGLNGNLEYAVLPGKTIAARTKGTVQLEPFGLKLKADVSSNTGVFTGKVYANLSKKLDVGGEILTADGRKVKLNFQNGALNSSGEINLATLNAFLPKSAQGQISGVAKLNFVNTNGSGTLNAKAFGIPIKASVQVQNNRVTTQANVTGTLLKGARVTGQVFPSLNALLQYGTLFIEVKGKTDNFKYKAYGSLPDKSQLERLGLGSQLKKLGVAWNPDPVNLVGGFQNNIVTTTGKIGKLEIQTGRYNVGNQNIQANWRGSFAAQYLNKPIIVSNSIGQISLSKTGLNVNVRADKLEAEYQGQKANALGLDAVVQNSRGNTSFAVTAKNVDAKLAGQVLKSQNLKAKGSISQNSSIKLAVNADKLDANLQGQKVQAQNLSAKANISSSQKFDVQVQATSLDALVQGQKVQAQNLSAKAKVSSSQRFDLQINAASLSGKIEGQTIKAQKVQAFAFSSGKTLNAKLEAQAIAGEYQGVSFDLQQILASAKPANGKLEFATNLGSGKVALRSDTANISKLELEGNISTLDVTKLTTAKLSANLKASSFTGSLQGIGGNAEKLNLQVSRTGSSITGNFNSSNLAATGKDWQVQTSNLTAQNIQLNLDKLEHFATDIRVLSVTGAYQKNPFKLENTTLALNSGETGLGLELSSAALVGQFEGYDIRATQLNMVAKLERNLINLNLKLESAETKNSPDQFRVANLELLGRYNLKTGNGNITDAKIGTLQGNLAKNYLTAQTLTGSAELLAAKSGKLEDALFKGKVTGNSANGIFAGQDFKLEQFNANGQKQASNYQGSLKANRALGAWQDIAANLEQFEVNAKLENQRLSGNLTGQRGSGKYQNTIANLEQFKFSGELIDQQWNGQLDAARVAGTFDSGNANLSNLKARASGKNSLIQVQIESSSANGMYQEASAKTERLKLNATIKDSKVAADFTSLRASGTYQQANAELEQIVFMGKLENQILTADLNATRATGAYQEASGTLEKLNLKAMQKDGRIEAKINASQAFGMYQDASAQLENFDADTTINGQNIAASVTGQTLSGTWQQAKGKLEQFNFTGKLEQDVLTGNLKAKRGNGTYQNAKLNLEQLKLQVGLNGKKISTQLEAAHAEGAFNDLSGNLEQVWFQSAINDQALNGILKADSGFGKNKDGQIKLEQFKLDARKPQDQIFVTLQAVHGVGAYQKASANLSDFTAKANVLNSRYQLDLHSARGTGNYQNVNAKLEQFLLVGTLENDHITGNLEGQKGTGNYQDASANLEEFKLNADVLGGLTKADLVATRGAGTYQNGHANLEQFKLNAKIQNNDLRGTLEASSGNGTWQDASANLEQFKLNAQMQNNDLQGTLEALKGDGTWQDANAKLENFTLNAQSVNQKVSAAIKGQHLNGVWQDNKLELQDFRAAGNVIGKEINGELAAENGVGVWDKTNVHLNQFSSNGTMLGKRISGKLAAKTATANRSNVNLELMALQAQGSLEGSKIALDVNADSGAANTENLNKLLKDFNLSNAKIKPQQFFAKDFFKAQNSKLIAQSLMLKQDSSNNPAHLQLAQFNAKLEAQGQNVGGTLQASSGAGNLGDDQLNLQAFQAKAKLNGNNLDSSFNGALAGTIEQQVFEADLNGTLAVNLERLMDQTWRGNLNLKTRGRSAKAEAWKLEAQGPWSALNVNGNAPSKFLAGFANTQLPTELETIVNLDGLVRVPKLEFNLNAKTNLGTLEKTVQVQSKIKGNLQNWNVNADLQDAQGGTAKASFDSGLRGKLKLERFNLALFAGQNTFVSGNLKLENKKFYGALTSEYAGFPISANWLEDGSFQANVGGTLPFSVRAKSWEFPLEISELAVKTQKSAYPIELNAISTLELGAKNGQFLNAEGILRVLNYSQTVPGGKVALEPTELQFSASIGKTLGIRVTKESDALVFDGQAWSGGLSLPYSAWEKTGMAKLQVSGALTDPNIKLESSGILNINVGANLHGFSAQGDLDLTGIAKALPENIAKSTQPGRVGFDLLGKITPQLEVSAAIRSLNASVDGDVVRLTAQAKLEGQTWSVTGETAVGNNSSSTFKLSNTGLIADQLDLDLRLLRILGVAASGRVSGTISLPKFDFMNATGNLKLEHVKAFDVTADGTAQVEAGQLKAHVLGFLPGDYTFALDGDVYPQTNARLNLDGLNGIVSGDALEGSRNLKLQATGQFFKKTTTLQASLKGSSLETSATWDVATLNAVAELNSNGVTGTGHVLIPGFEALEKLIGQKLNGHAEADLVFHNLDLRAKNLKGIVEGVKFDGLLEYQNTSLNTALKLEYPSASAVLNGQLYPDLNASFTGDSSFDFAPSKFTGTATGSLAHPDVKVKAVLGQASLGLIAPGTALEATFDGKRFGVNLNGSTVLGVIEGSLNGLEQVNLRFIKANAVYQDSSQILDGALSWSSNLGFGGELHSSGTFLSDIANLALFGRNELALSLNWRNGRVNAILPASLGQELNAKLELERFDVGALWHKPGQLGITAHAQATGTWTQPNINLTGKLEDAKDDLTADILATYSKAGLVAKLEGAKIQLDGTWDAGHWRLGGNFKNVQLGPLLPIKVATLEVSGLVTASDAGEGLKANLSNLKANGELEPVGAFGLSGDAQYAGDTTTANLSASILEGKLSLLGRLDSSLKTDGIDAKLEGINLASFGIEGLVDGALKLVGEARDPNVTGNLKLKNFRLSSQDDWFADALVAVSGKLLNPKLEADTTFSGSASGKLKLSTSDILGATRIGLAGQAKVFGIEFDGALEGLYPKLAGQANVRVPSLPTQLSNFQLQGTSEGTYLVKLENALKGSVKLEESLDRLNPNLSGELEFGLDLNTLLESAVGKATGHAKLSGSIFTPNISLNGDLKQLAVSSVTAPDMKLEGNWSLQKLNLKASYQDGVIEWDGKNVSAKNLELKAASQTIKLDSSGVTSPALDLGFTGTLAGTATASFIGRYLKDTLNLDLNAKISGVNAKGTANGNLSTGWTGTIALDGLPKTTLYGDEPENSGVANLKLSGAFAAPKLEGDVHTLGMRLGLTANTQPLEVQLEAKPNPDPNSANLGGVRSSGTINLDKDGNIHGSLEYQERATSLRITPSGKLSQPQAILEVSQGKLKAKAQVQLLGTDFLHDLRAAFEITDGTNTGNLKLENAKLTGKIPKLNLNTLELEGYGGSLGLETNLEIKDTKTFGLQGTANATWSKVITPFEIPSLGWKIDGTGSAFFLSESEKSAKVALTYAGTPGTAKGEFRLENDLWQGQVNLDLTGKNESGKIQGQVTLDAKGIHGKLEAQALPIQASGLSATTTATIILDNDSFTANGTAQTLGGKARFEGTGGLSNLIPALEAYTHSAPENNPYSITASLDTVKLEEIAVVHQFAPNAKGRVYGGVQIVDGITTFLISVPDLTLPSTTTSSTATSSTAGETHVRFQVSGSAADSSIRFKGTLGSTRQPGQGAVNLDSYGNSDFQGSYDGENISGNLDLRNAPLHALAGAVFGALPGSALVTGKARYNIPIKNPLAGELRASFDKLEIGEGRDALVGSATAIYALGNLELDGLHLRSKNGGEWLGSGRYSKNLVNLKLGFSNTSFTPVLDLIPSLRGLNPEASGTLNLELKGEYGKPNAVLNVANFKGKLAGVRLNAKELTGKLENNKLEIKGQITTDESFNAALDTVATANLVSYAPIKLENLEARATGSLEVSPIGRIENINARAFGDSGGFKLEATAKKGGVMTITGDISPRLNLHLLGQDLIFKIPDYYLSDSLMDADLTMRGDGKDYLMAGTVLVAKALGSLDQGKLKTPTAPKAAVQAQERKNPVFERIKFQNIKIKAVNGLKVNESILKLEAGGDLQLGGTLAAPELNGAVDALEVNGTKGTLKLGSYTYNISSVNASFNQVQGIYPSIRLVGKTTINTPLRNLLNLTELKSAALEVTLVLTVTFKRDAKGDLKIKTDTQLSSVAPNNFQNPSEADLYSLITLNSSQGLSIGGVGQSAINTFFTVFFFNEVSRVFKEQTGLDLVIDTNLFDELITKPGDAQNFTLSFSLGANLTDQLRLNVNLNLGRTDSSSNRILQSTIYLNYTTTDNAFSIKFALPFELQNNITTNTTQFTGFNPEASFSYNFSSIWSITLGLEYKDFYPIFKFGFTLRF